MVVAVSAVVPLLTVLEVLEEVAVPEVLVEEVELELVVVVAATFWLSEPEEEVELLPLVTLAALVLGTVGMGVGPQPIKLAARAKLNKDPVFKLI